MTFSTVAVIAGLIIGAIKLFFSYKEYRTKHPSKKYIAVKKNEFTNYKISLRKRLSNPTKCGEYKHCGETSLSNFILPKIIDDIELREAVNSINKKIDNYNNDLKKAKDFMEHETLPISILHKDYEKCPFHALDKPLKKLNTTYQDLLDHIEYCIK